MDIHGDNPFKSKSYASASFNIEKLPVPLHALSASDLFATKGIGESTGKKVLEILETGKLEQLEKLIASTPPGIMEMLQIKGIGPKKIHTIWKEMQIESLGELLYACNENRLLLYKGFGAKTQQNVKDAIEFFLSHQDQFLFAEIEAHAEDLQHQLQSSFPNTPFFPTGAFRQQHEIIRQLEWVTTLPASELLHILTGKDIECLDQSATSLIFKGEKLPLVFYLSTTEELYLTLFKTSCSESFLKAWQQQYPLNPAASEEEIFSRHHLPYLPPCLREDPSSLTNPLPELIQPGDIRGIIHSHSNWSDGLHTLEQMAKACIQRGLEYLVISDHSKSAFYANGLNEERIFAQHQEIDELNKKLAPFRIFKSIECDILNDGSLDYPDEVLARFDLVIASVHSNLKMSEEKAMNRLLTAIAHPYTTILGHMTGRLLLSRPGYPVDHTRIIAACKAADVVIELNAHPRRLDIDWRYIRQATEAGVLISINPDAHATEGFDDTRYGVLVAQKGGLTAKQNLSSFSRNELVDWLENRRRSRQR
jgi:DNA polymerase (family 10)